MKNKDAKVQVRTYQESCYPRDHWIWAIHREGTIPQWREGGSSLDETRNIIRDAVGDGFVLHIESGRFG